MAYRCFRDRSALSSNGELEMPRYTDSISRRLINVSKHRSFTHVRYCIFAVTLLSAGAFPVGGETGASLTILVLDASTAKPISKVAVFLLTWDAKGTTRKLGQVTTRKDGTAVLWLRETLPERIGISYSPDEAKRCSDIAFPAKDILSVGVVAKNNCDTGAQVTKVRPQAGELVVFASKVSLSERLSREMP
jgi:hypothetical protein